MITISDLSFIDLSFEKISEDTSTLIKGGYIAQHKVNPGETLWDIADKYCASPTSWPKIAKQSKISDPKKLKVGQTVYFPYPC